VQLVLKSIGYKSLPLPGLPFDNRQGVVPNAAGRVMTGGRCWTADSWSQGAFESGTLACSLPAHALYAAISCLVRHWQPLGGGTVPTQVLLSNFRLCCACVLATAGVGAAADSTLPGLYVCGWLKRGPTGIIGTNLTDAEETVASMAQDYATIARAPEAAPGRAGLQQLLDSRGVAVVNYPAWEQLNAFEVSQGQQQGSVRVKCASWDELLGAAGVRAQQAACGR
jgi:NADPH-dependent glutamate synthase beta subunit-like oxidoreductase